MKKRFEHFELKLFALGVLVMMGVVGCAPQTPEHTEELPIKTSISELQFDWTYNEQAFEIVSTVPFLVGTDVEWLTTDWSRFVAGSHVLTVAAHENPDEEIREGALTLYPENLEPIVIPVMQFENQASEIFEVLTPKIEVNSFAQSSCVKVKSGSSFSLVTVASWIKVPEKTFGAGEEVEIPIEVERNMGEARSAKISIRTSDGRKWIEALVSQTPFEPKIDISVDTLQIDGNGGAVAFNVLGDLDFEVTSDDVWAKPQTKGAFSAGTAYRVVVDVERNEFSSARQTKIHVTSTNGGLLQYEIVLMQGERIPSVANNITKISLLKRLNPTLDKDYVMTPDSLGRGVFSCYIPAVLGDPYVTVQGTAQFPTLYPFDIENVVLTFETDAKQVYVGNELMVSGKSACDLSTTTSIKAVAESGDVREYKIDLTYFTGLPIMFIDLDSNNEVASRDNYEAGTVKIIGADDFPGLEEQRFMVHGRGNSSWGTFRKKPSYTFKLEDAQEVLGMPAHKKWVMIGNYRDKTLLRNQVAWWLSERLPALSWTPRYRQVELVLNGTHRGVYQLTEQVRIGKDRLNIAEMLPTDTKGEAITGGYIVEFHYGSDGDQWGWDMPVLRGNSGASVKQPKIEDSNEAQRDYIMDYVLNIDKMFGEAANGGDPTEVMTKYIDMPSWAAQWLVFEISGTTEPQGPNSWYTYKQRGDDKWYCGPAWDFDYRSYIPSTASGWVNYNTLYLPEMLRYRPFRTELISQWRNILEPLLPELLEYVEQQREYLRLSAEANWRLHDQNLIDDGRRENGDEQLESDVAIDRMVTYLHQKWVFISRNITSL